VKAATIVLVNRLPYSGDNVVTFVKSAILLTGLPIDQKSLPLTHEPIKELLFDEREIKTFEVKQVGPTP
jgi:hypothetical protein